MAHMIMLLTCTASIQLNLDYVILYTTVDPWLSKPQCVSENGKGVQISELFG